MEIIAKKIATVGNNGQISIGKEFAGKEVLIQKHADGHLVIYFGQFVPDHQQTFYTNESKAQLEEFEHWFEKNPSKATEAKDLRTFLKAARRDKKS